MTSEELQLALSRLREVLAPLMDYWAAEERIAHNPQGTTATEKETEMARRQAAAQYLLAALDLDLDTAAVIEKSPQSRGYYPPRQRHAPR